MFLAQPSSILVRGNIKTLEYKYVNYKIYEPIDITKITTEDYIKEKKKIIIKQIRH